MELMPPILLIDMGNSRLKFALFNQATPSDLGPVSALANDASSNAWQAVLAGLALEQNQASNLTVLISNVASSAALQAASTQLNHFFGHQIRIHSWHNTPLPEDFHCRYQSPGLGSDRLLAALAARRAMPSPHALVVASFGTATTVDTLLGNQYCGGLILPGIDLMQRSLNQATARLPHRTGRLQAIPSCTDDAIYSGIMAAQRGAIEYALVAAGQRIDAASQSVGLVASGGAAAQISRHLPLHFALDHAVLRGLAVIACETATLTSHPT